MHIPHTQSLVYTSRQESQNVRVRCRLSEFAGWHAFDVDTKYEATERERYYGHFVPFCQCVVYFNFIAIVYVCPLRISYTHTHTHQTMRECMGQCVSLDEPQAHTPYTVHRTHTNTICICVVCLFVCLTVCSSGKQAACTRLCYLGSWFRSICVKCNDFLLHITFVCLFGTDSIIVWIFG